MTSEDKLLLHHYREKPASVGGFLAWSSQVNFQPHVEEQLQFIDKMFKAGLDEDVLQRWMDILEEALDVREPRSKITHEHFQKYGELDERYEKLYPSLRGLTPCR